MFKNINYVNCKSLESVFEYINNPALKCCILAGGTDVITGIRNESNRFNKLDYIVDLKNVSEVHKIEEFDDYFLVGAFVTFSEIIDNEKIKNEFPLLIDAIKRIGNLQVRNRATIGGNIVNCAPCADSVPPLLVYDAKFIIKSKDEENELLLSDFLISPYKTKLKSNELLCYIKIPKNKEKLTGTFQKLGKRKGVAISRISLAVLIKITNGKLETIKFASGAITPIASRFYNVEQKYVGNKFGDEEIKAFTFDVASEILSKTGIRWSYPYKLPVFQQLLFCEIKKLIL
ncbi:MAG: FAD binding domain-containing protein [bacterium]